MRAISSVLFAALCLTTPFARTQQPTPQSRTQQDLTAALLGSWTGVLEYRDYSEPATSTKRVDLPTWLTVSQSADSLRLTYTYDDGPNKILTESSVLVMDAAAATYKVTASDSAISSYRIAGLDGLKDGRGQLILTGPGKDNNKPAEMRITLTIRRNLLEWLEEVRPTASPEAFTFRHLYRFTRAQPPAPSQPTR